MMNDELWTPSDLQVTDLQVTLKYVDVRRPVDRVGRFIPASFRAVATVLVGVNGAGDPIFQNFAADGGSVDDVLGKVWAAARVAQVKAG